jgi:hypothetical protein
MRSPCRFDKVRIAFVVVALCAVSNHLDAQTASVEELLDRATAYVDEFFDRFANVVAEEQYVQEMEFPRRANLPTQKRVLRSDFLLVTFPGLNGRMSFRDVFEVDGLTVRDTRQDDRLATLFANAPQDAVQRARVITATSAQHNLAGVETDPFIAMGYLQAVFRPRFRFRRGDDNADLGPSVRTVTFDERDRPTVLKAGADVDLPSRGRIWIEEPTGRVVRTELLLRFKEHRREIVTTYRWDDELEMHVLGEVRESALIPPSGGAVTIPAGTFRGTATYSRFRRFQVRTQETIR